MTWRQCMLGPACRIERVSREVFMGGAVDSVQPLKSMMMTIFSAACSAPAPSGAACSASSAHSACSKVYIRYLMFPVCSRVFGQQGQLNHARRVTGCRYSSTPICPLPKSKDDVLLDGSGLITRRVTWRALVHYAIYL
jgi:hypothetical protein